MRLRGPRAGVLLAALALAGAGCAVDPGGDPVRDGGSGGLEGGDELGRQHADVHALADEVTDAVAPEVAATVDRRGGRYTSCGSTGIDRIGSFRFTYDVRLVVAPGTPRPYLDAVATAYADLGLRPERAEVPGGARLSATRGELSVTATEREVAGEVLLLAFAGPCVETDPDDTERWLRLGDNAPGTQG